MIFNASFRKRIDVFDGNEGTVLCYFLRIGSLGERDDIERGEQR